MTDTRSTPASESVDRFSIKCETAGALNDDLTVNTNVSQCGYIKDGVLFRSGESGGWVLSFADLKRIYESACERRGFAQSESAPPMKLLKDLRYEFSRLLAGAPVDRERIARLIERINEEPCCKLSPLPDLSAPENVMRGRD